MIEQQEEKMSEQKSVYERSGDLPARLECQSNGLWTPDDAVAKAIADLVEAHNTMMLSTNCSDFFVDEPPPIGVARARRAEAAIEVMRALLIEGLESLDPPSD